MAGDCVYGVLDPHTDTPHCILVCVGPTCRFPARRPIHFTHIAPRGMRRLGLDWSDIQHSLVQVDLKQRRKVFNDKLCDQLEAQRKVRTYINALLFTM